MATVMACFSSNPSTPHLLHCARDLAHPLDARLLALHSRLPSSAPGYLIMLEAHAELAQELGAEVLLVDGCDVAQTIVTVAAQYQVTHLVLGEPAPQHWYMRWHKPLVRRLLRRLQGTDIYIAATKSVRLSSLLRD